MRYDTENAMAKLGEQTEAPGDAEDAMLDSELHWISTHESVHACHTVTAKAILDSGANLNIFKHRALPYMSNKRQSQFGVGGFTGAQVRADKFGLLHMYVFDPARPDDGVDLELPGTTMEGMAIPRAAVSPC